jgi:hypothetical protein
VSVFVNVCVFRERGREGDSNNFFKTTECPSTSLVRRTYEGVIFASVGSSVSIIAGWRNGIQVLSKKLWAGVVNILNSIIGDDISIKSSNLKLNINDVCNLISVSSEHFN